jgi:hypothetical protein
MTPSRPSVNLSVGICLLTLAGWLSWTPGSVCSTHGSPWLLLSFVWKLSRQKPWTTTWSLSLFFTYRSLSYAAWCPVSESLFHIFCPCFSCSMGEDKSSYYLSVLTGSNHVDFKLENILFAACIKNCSWCLTCYFLLW